MAANDTKKNGNKTQWTTVDDGFGTPWKPETAGESLEGYYLGMVDVKGQDGTFTSYQIRREDDTVLGVSGASLGGRMLQIPKGTLVRITYNGRIQNKSNPSRSFKDFHIQVAAGTVLLAIDNDEFPPKALAAPGSEVDVSGARA